ncbi:hypothetical protein V2J09_021583 [Rumex salicifolius]
MEEERKRLPIYRRREQFLKAIEASNILIVNGGSTSGKATQFPQYLHESEYTKKGKIGSTLPSDFAALGLARRVSKEMGVELGQEVGYSTQFENCTSDKTVIEYMTDKRLLQELIHDRKLTSYSVLIVEEAHQRTVSTDLLLGFLKNLAVSGGDLKVIISGVFSDDAEDLAGYCNYAPRFRIKDNTPSVEKIYLSTLVTVTDCLFSAVSKVLDIHAAEPSGDILVFLQGQEEIELAEAILRYKILCSRDLSAEQLRICPVLPNLSSEIQTEIFEPTPVGFRKVVLLSDDVDAYLIGGISYVIDSGIRDIKGYYPINRSVSWFSCPISKASAKERADLCGLTGGHGKCFRLYPESNMDYMLDDTMPEIRLACLAHAALTLKCLEHSLEALDLLYALDAVDDVGKITETGRKMAEFPLEPMLSKMIVASEKYKCSSEIITIAAMLLIGNSAFYSTVADQVRCDNARRSFYAEDGGDHIALLKVYTSWAGANYSAEWCVENDIQAESMKLARGIRDHLEGVLERVKIEVISNPNPNDLVGIKKAITAGFFLQSAKLQKRGDYRMIIKRQRAILYPSPSLPQVLPRCIVYHEVVGEQGLALTLIMEVKREWLVEIAPRYYRGDNMNVVGVEKLPRGQWNADMH